MYIFYMIINGGIICSFYIIEFFIVCIVFLYFVNKFIRVVIYIICISFSIYLS